MEGAFSWDSDLNLRLQFGDPWWYIVVQRVEITILKCRLNNDKRLLCKVQRQLRKTRAAYLYFDMTLYAHDI